MSEDALVAHAFSENAKDDELAQIKVGMEVRDRLGEKVGTVDEVYGAGGDGQPAAAREVGPQPTATGLPSDMPREVSERLLHDGFVRIDAGFLHHHRYALRSQIDRVEVDDRVSLTAVAADLIKG